MDYKRSGVVILSGVAGHILPVPYLSGRPATQSKNLSVRILGSAPRESLSENLSRLHNGGRIARSLRRSNQSLARRVSHYLYDALSEGATKIQVSFRAQRRIPLLTFLDLAERNGRAEVRAMKTYHVYIMASASRVLYVGVTNHLVRRVSEHKQGAISGFSARYRTKELVYFQPFGSIRAAIAREKQIKGWLRARKTALIDAFNPEWKDLSDALR